MAKPSLTDRGRQFLEHVLPAIVKPIHTLWHEVIGFLFLAFAIWAALSGIRHIREFDGGSESIFRIALTGVFVLVMLGFGISAFRRARKISRS